MLTTIEKQNIRSKDFELILLTAYPEYVDIEDVFDLKSKEPSPEQRVIKNDLYSKLSKDAKDVISFILNRMETLFKDGHQTKWRGNCLKTRIKRFFPHRRGFTMREIDKVFHEIGEYVKTF